MAEEGLKRLHWRLTHSHLEPMKDMGLTLKGHWHEILNYFDHRRTTGALEAALSRPPEAKHADIVTSTT